MGITRGEFIEPNGKVHDVEDTTHWEWANKYLGDEKRFDDNPLRELLLRGWVRVVYSYNDSIILITTKRQLTRQQKEYLEDRAEETHWAVYDDDGVEIYRSVDCVSKEHPLNENVKQLPPEFGLNVKTGRRWWMDPDGNLYGFNTKYNHPEWAEKYLRYIGVTDDAVLNYPQGEMYKMGWVRVVFMFDRNNQMVLMYEHDRPLTNKQKREIRDFAIELRVDYMADRSEKTRQQIWEVTQKDVNATMPGVNAWDITKRALQPPIQNPKLNMMTMGNLKALRDKAARTISYYRNNQESESLKIAKRDYKFYNDELRRRLAYVNKPVNENDEALHVKRVAEARDIMVNSIMKVYRDMVFSKEELEKLQNWNREAKSNKFQQFLRYKAKEAGVEWVIDESTEPSIGGSYSDQATNVEPDDITQMERDPLTDPELNNF